MIPELSYADVEAAATWLCAAFGFTLRFRFGRHRAQLNIGDGGAMVVREGAMSAADAGSHSVMIRVPDVDSHCAAARAAGATILIEPQDYEYGERQYSVRDIGGHHWTFTQSIHDFDPAVFGAVIGTID